MSRYAKAAWEPYQDGGGYIPASPKGVLHTTEGKSYKGAQSAYAAGMAPHFTVSVEIGEFQCWQHIDTKLAARALEHISGTVDTNRANAIQIEIVWSAANARAMPKILLDGLGKLMRWIEIDRGIKRQSLPFHSDTEGLVLARDTSPIRLPPTNWLTYSGWVGHQHVPGNSHWDPGMIDINYLLTVGAGVKPMYEPAIGPFAAAWLDEQGKVISAITPKGEVYWGKWYGNVAGKPYWGTRIVATIGARPDGQPGYRITSTDGGFYDLPDGLDQL